ncbi:MAG TPA: DnaJ domain-containing protein, partial [Dehalococcoidia bacterium]|nr:DnaJ domain-containing protein [Dehalococcoidia bacterium]
MDRDERGPGEEVEQEPGWREPEPAASSWSAEPAAPPPDETPARLPDYYAALGVPPGSSRRTIARAYDRLSRELQPDVNAPPADPDRMRRLDEAFDFLDDPARRPEYDRARGIEPLKGAGRRAPDRGTLLAAGLILGGLGAIAAAGVVLALALLDEGGVNCSAADGETVTTPNGVEYEDIVVCDGPELTVGDTVDANYIGRLE